MMLNCVELILRVSVTVISVIDLIIYHTLVCISNARKLFDFLLRGTRTWIIMLGRLLIFTCVLSIGWYRLIKYWVFNPLILRNVEYGQGGKFRNLMDIYLPAPHNPSHGSKTMNEVKAGAPVIIFVSGGAWTIGYKLWSALVARGLSYLGIVTIVPDYRNFPQGDIEDMMADIRAAVEWTRFNASKFGGDPDKIVLAGQSAGAHICTCLLVDDFLRTKNNHQYYGRSDNVNSTASVPTPLTVGTAASQLSAADTDNNSKPPLYKQSTPKAKKVRGSNYSDNRSEENAMHVEIPIAQANSGDADDFPSNATTNNKARIEPVFNTSEHIKLFIGVSGPYNLYALVAHLQQRGLDASIIDHICKGDVVRYSPSIQLHEFCNAARIALNTVLNTEPFCAEMPAVESAIHENLATLLLLKTDDSATTQGTSPPTRSGLKAINTEMTDSDDIPICLSTHSSRTNSPLHSSSSGKSSSSNSTENMDTYSEKEPIVATQVESETAAGFTDRMRVQVPQRPFYAYYLPQVHNFLTTTADEYDSVDKTANTPLPSSQNLQQQLSGQTHSSAVPHGDRQHQHQHQHHHSKHLVSLPPVVLFHGSSDKSIPVSICTDLHDTLLRNGAQVELKIYNHWSHTDAILEAPLSGNMRLFYDMVDCIEAHTCRSVEDSEADEGVLSNNSPVSPIPPNPPVLSEDPSQQSPIKTPGPHCAVRPRKESDWYDDRAGDKYGAQRKKLEPMVPRVLVNIARKINPF